MINSEIVAKALEISIALTREADHTWIHEDGQGSIFVKEPLFTTLKTVIRLMNSSGIIDLTGGDIRTFPER